MVKKKFVINKINKLTHYCNSSQISFFKPCMKETIVAAVFIFELIRDLWIKKYLFFWPLFVLRKGISGAICNLVLQLLKESMNKLLRQDGVLSQYLKKVAEARSKQNHIHLFYTICSLFSKSLLKRGYYGVHP